MMLIELLIAIVIMSVGFVALVAAFSTTERQAGQTADVAQLTTLSRQVADVIKAQSAQGGLTYVACAAASDYQTQVNGNSSITGAKGSDSIAILSVAQGDGSLANSWHTFQGSSTHVALIPVKNCASGASDYGVQRITFKVSSKNASSVQRIVYKRWN